MQTAKEVLEFAKANNVEFFDFRFTDIKGTWHHVSFYKDAVDEDKFKGIPFDGSSIPYWQSIDQSDMLLIPDPTTAFLDPFTARPTLIVICDVYDIYKDQPYEKCPRSIAKKALKYAEEAGIADTAFFGPENEFFIFDNVIIRDEMNGQGYEVDTTEGVWNRDHKPRGEIDEINIGHRPNAKEGYFPVPPVDSMMDLRSEIVTVLEQVGLEPNVSHHEVGQAQGEIGIKFGTLVEAGDKVQKLKYVVKMVAHQHGKTATFMPKPLYGDNGNGMHTHQSLWKDGKNLFAGDEYEGLSKLAMNYIAGVLHHAPALAAFTNASTNSYKRLQPGFEAPNILTYSAQNRSAAVRIPYVHEPKAKRIEVRFPDSSSNPYLAFTAMMMAGLDGIKKDMDPGASIEQDLFELTIEEIEAKGIKTMPATFREAMDKLRADSDFLRQGDVFTELFLDTYRAMKFEKEIIPFEGRPHPFEFIISYSC
ncbi:MAG: type I glutamate--ammonia ligase [Candidatus Hydrogenedentota bacterium]|nr:MAG: type I glutamate--ammonia ligase [Candidatus Hydrogenedentota bacterium]